MKTIVDALVDDDPEYLEVTNDLNRELHFSDRDEIKSEYVRNGGTIEPIEIIGYKDSYNYASFFDFLRIFIGAQVILPNIVILGKRLKCWNTIPIF